MKKKLLSFLIAVSLVIPVMPVHATEVQEELLPVVEEQVVEEIAIETAEENAEEVVEENEEENAEEAVEEGVEETAEEAVKEGVEETAEEVVEESVEEIAEETAEEAVKESVEETAEEIAEETTEETAEEAVEESVEEIAEENAEEAVKENVEATVGAIAEEVITEEILQETVYEEDEINGLSGDLYIDSNVRTITLTENTTVNNVYLFTNGKLDLAGYTLNVTGNVVQKGGSIVMNRSTMNVSGDFIQEEGYDSRLYMEYSNDILNISGDFATKSTSENRLSAGRMTVKGDFIIGAGDNNNFRAIGEHKVILTGPNSHYVEQIDSNFSSIQNQFANLEVESGKITCNNLICIESLKSDLEITPVNCDEIIVQDIQMNGHNVTINGNVKQIYGYNDSINVAGGKLTVKGNFTQEEGILYLNKGTMDVSGDYIQEEGYAGYLQMKYSNDILNISGDFVTKSTTDSTLSAGKMTVKGDFIIGAGDNYNFHATGEHKVILSGPNSHYVEQMDSNFSSIQNQFANLEVESGKITCNNLICIEKLNSDLEITPVNCDEIIVQSMGMSGHNVTINGNVKQIYGYSDSIDLAGGKLTVKGSFTQEEGSLYFNKGTMDVSGDFIQEEGYAGYLHMKYSNDILNVSGDFVTKSTANNTLSAGKMTIKGDFYEGAGNKRNFLAYGTHQVRLTGDRVQNVTFENYPYSTFNQLYLSKPMATGYVFSPNPCWESLASWPFMDVTVKPGNWKYEAVEYVYGNNIMNGVGDGTRFDPDAPLTREMFATVLYRIAGQPAVTYTNKFPDVPRGKWYSDAVIWASEQGIVSGYTNGKFGTGDYITREQIAKMLMEYCEKQGYDISQSADFNKFADAGKVSGWAGNYMKWAVGSGMIGGSQKDGKYYLNPKGNATRAESATMLKRFDEKY